MKTEDAISHRIILAAIEVHRSLGPGLLESAYEECLCHEFQLLGLLMNFNMPLMKDGIKRIVNGL